MVGEIFRTGGLIADVPIESVLQTNVVDFHVEFEGADAAALLYLRGAVGRNGLADGVSDLAFEMHQGGVLGDY